MTLGERLKRLRELRELSQNALAKRAGVSRPIISALESDKQQGMSVETARRLAKALNVSLDMLVGIDEQLPELTPIGDYLERLANEYLQCIKRSEITRIPDTCYICGRTPEETRAYYQKRIKQTYKDNPSSGEELLHWNDETEFSHLTYRTIRPLCQVCYHSLRGISGLKSTTVIDEIISEVRTKGDELWPDPWREIPGMITPDDV